MPVTDKSRSPHRSDDLAATLRTVLAEYGVARHEDLQQHKDECNAAMLAHKTQVQQCLEAVSDRMDKLQEQLDAVRKEACSDDTSTAASVATVTTGSKPFAPSRIFVRGWAPYGSSTTSRINEAAAIQLQEKVLQLLPQARRHHLEAEKPYFSNYQVAFRIKDPDLRRDTAMLRDWREALEASPIHIRGNEIKISMEASPLRKKQYQGFVQAKRLLEEKDKQDITHACGRTCTIYHKESLATLWSYGGGWDSEVAASIEFDVPGTFSPTSDIRMEG